jgi:hypothetical protein
MKKVKSQFLGITTFAVLFLIMILVSFFVLIPQPKKKEHCIQLVWWLRDFAFGQKPTMEFYPEIADEQRIYKIFQLSTDSNRNKDILSEFRHSLHRIKSEKDTINALDLIIDDRTSWQDYIAALDICMQERPFTFVPDGNHIWALYYAPSRSLRSSRPIPHVF